MVDWCHKTPEGRQELYQNARGWRGETGGLGGCGVERLRWGVAVVREKRVGVGAGAVMVVVVNGLVGVVVVVTVADGSDGSRW